MFFLIIYDLLIFTSENGYKNSKLTKNGKMVSFRVLSEIPSCHHFRYFNGHQQIVIGDPQFPMETPKFSSENPQNEGSLMKILLS